MTKPLPIPTETFPQVRDEDAGFGALQTPRGNLPLKSVDVRACIEGLLARTIVKQTFVNPFDEHLEATYIFPLPDRAAVTRFRLTVAGRVVEGELQERAQAREAYEKAILEGQRAAIAEEERPNTFTMRVGNLPPNEAATVELVTTGPLPIDSGEATFRFPLVVAPRYIPGTPLPGNSVGDGTEPDTDAVPDASRITPPVLLPGQPNPVQLSLEVEIRPGNLAFSDFRSSLHVLQADGLRFRLGPNERMDRDFILRFRFDESTLRTSLQFQPDADGTGGTFALTVIPPRDSGRQQKPRDVLFVLDRSGSMGGWKMLAARRALARMIDSLTPDDRFVVLAFDSTIESFPENGSLQAAIDRQRFRAVEFLAKVEARGGTEIAKPLKQALAALTDPARDRVLVLLTDGQVGNEDQVLNAIGKSLKGIRIFTLGVDQAVNEGFLKRLAGIGGGYMELVESEDRLDAVMDKVHRRIGSPVLSKLKLEPAGLAFEPGTLVPDRIPDLFPGMPLTILGRYREARNAETGLSLQATDDSGRPFSATVMGSRGEVLAPVWARSHLRDLEDRYATNRGNQQELEKQIVATSLKFGVLCRFTAFVAVDVKEVVNEGGKVHRVTQPVEPAAGWDMLRSDHGTVDCMIAASACLSAPVGGTGLRSRGIMRKLSKSVAESKRAARGLPDDTAVIEHADLTAYRQRADELRKNLESSADAARALGTLALKLEELLDDLKSIGADDAERQPLSDLLTELQTFVARPSPVGNELAAMLKHAGEVLAAFAEGKKPAKGRSWKFWK
jgi:Ca-activated chloride channel homolog